MRNLNHKDTCEILRTLDGAVEEAGSAPLPRVVLRLVYRHFPAQSDRNYLLKLLDAIYPLDPELYGCLVADIQKNPPNGIIQEMELTARVEVAIKSAHPHLNGLRCKSTIQMPMLPF